MISRVTSQTTMRAAQQNLQHSASELARLQERASSLNKISKPSDDPIGTADSMRVRAEHPLLIAFFEQRWSVALPLPWFTVPIGVSILVLASALGLWSAFVMSTRGDGTPLPSAMPHRLVLAGPYRWVRNPMAVAGIVQGAAVGLMLSSWLVVAYAVAGSLLWNYAIRPHEEADLEERFGDEFRQYRDSVQCWIPRVPTLPRVAPPLA